MWVITAYHGATAVPELQGRQGISTVDLSGRRSLGGLEDGVSATSELLVVPCARPGLVAYY